MSVVLLPKYRIPGYEDEDPEVAARELHNEKNGPISRVGEDRLKFPPYPYKPGEERYEYPHAMYREWDEDNRLREELLLAQKMGLDLNDRRQASLVNRAMPAFETALARDAKHFHELESQGWAGHPKDVKTAQDRYNKAIALAAAERATEDRRLGPQAARELEAIEDAADHHVIDVAETRREVAAKKAGR